jgi:hypothetical protein
MNDSGSDINPQPSHGAFKILVWLTWYSLLSGLVLAFTRCIVLYLPFDHPASDVADVVAGGTLLGMAVLFMTVTRAAVSPKWGASVFPIVVVLWMIATGITWWNCLLLPLVASSNVAIDSVVVSMTYSATVFISGLVVSVRVSAVVHMLTRGKRHWFHNTH